MLSGLNKDLAVVSKTPGRTRLINMFKCKDKDGGICMFVDLPGKLLRQLKAPNIIFMERLGYGFAKLSKGEQSKVSDFLSKYLIDRGSLRLVVVLVDIRREVQEADREIIEVRPSFPLKDPTSISYQYISHKFYHDLLHLVFRGRGSLVHRGRYQMR